MTSINIQTVSNKPNYKKFFSNPITFPKNTLISMPKANLKVPVIIASQIPVPNVTGNVTQVACEVTIDGIGHNITWQDIYNAHTNFPGCETFGGINEWAQNYKYIPTNQALMLDLGTAFIEKKYGFNEILARAITNKFNFYKVSPSPTFFISDTQNPFLQRQTITNPTSGAEYQDLDTTNNIQTQLGFNVSYAPEEVFARNQTFVNVNQAENAKINWIQSAALHGLRGATGECCCYMNQINFDCNGGYFHFFPNAATANQLGLISVGISLTGQGLQVNDEKIPFAAYDTTMIDIGLEFGYDGTNYVYNIIDKANQFNSTTDAPILHTKFEPHRKVNGYDNNGDHFFIQILRGNELQNTSGFIVNILQGVTLDPEDDDNLVTVYTKNININPEEKLVPLFMANAQAGVDAWEFNNIAYIEKTPDTIEQGDMNMNGNVTINSMSIEPVIDNGVGAADLTQELFNFWSAWGLFNRNIEPLGDKMNVSYLEFDGTQQQRRFKVDTYLESGAVDIKYYLGYTEFLDTFEYKTVGGSSFLQLNTLKAIDRLPQMLNVSVTNLDIKNFNGSLPYAEVETSPTQITTIADTQASDSRVVGTIPIPIDDIGLKNQVVDLSYEPFNLLYRPINNTTAFTINHLEVEVFYKDFYTNRKKYLNTVEGVMNIEFHIKSGGTPAPPNKIGLRPV